MSVKYLHLVRSDLLIQGFRCVRGDVPDAQHGMEKTLNDTNRREQRLIGVDGGSPAIRMAVPSARVSTRRQRKLQYLVDGRVDPCRDRPSEIAEGNS